MAVPPPTDFEPEAAITHAAGASSPPASLRALPLGWSNSPVSANLRADGVLIPFAAFSSTKSIPMSQASTPDRLMLPVGGRDHTRGPRDAPEVLVEYGGYQCPHSGQAYGIVQEIQQRLGDRLCFVFRHFPLTEIHPQAQKAAEAVECAGVQGRFWEMHDILFQRQPALGNGELVEYALELGLDMPQFLSTLAGRIYAERVYEDFESGVSSGVSSTPTFFINGVRHAGPWDLESLLAAIAAAGDA